LFSLLQNIYLTNARATNGISSTGTTEYGLERTELHVSAPLKQRAVETGVEKTLE
jgi:hypothetical protein